MLPSMDLMASLASYLQHTLKFYDIKGSFCHMSREYWFFITYVVYWVDQNIESLLRECSTPTTFHNLAYLKKNT